MEITNLVGLGDIHGNFGEVIDVIERMDLRDMYILQVGDFGMYNSLTILGDNIDNLDSVLKERNIFLYAIRGNHDDPIYFKGDSFKVESEYVTCEADMYGLKFIQNATNIILVPDYTVLELLGKRILCVGGAVSVDRSKLKEGYNYWSGEELEYNWEKLKDIHDINILCMHTLPESIYFNFGLNIKPKFVKQQLVDDPYLAADLDKELKEAEKIFKHVNTGQELKFYCGHFHKSLSTSFDNVAATILDINEFKMII